MNRTIQYYDKNAVEYAKRTRNADVNDLYTDFEACLEPGARILDLGCGSGRDSKYFLERGYNVVPTDGSRKMCRVAEQYLGIPVKQMLFSELSCREEFDGIWACASLLHVPERDFPDIMEKVSAALKPEGVLYASFKYGDSEEEIGGRHFTFYSENDLDWMFPDLGLIEYWISEDVIPGRDNEKWLNILWRKME